MTTRIGFLVPHSSIYPSMSKNIIDGFYAALPQVLIRKKAFEFVPVYIGPGKPEVLKEAVNRLIFFENCDIISGVINYRGSEAILPLIERSQKLGFFFDMGENIPTLLQVSERIFFNSAQLWQSEYALGNWAFRTFGDKGLVAMGLYDCGYHLQSAFRQGAIDAGSQEVDYSVFHGDPLKSVVEPNIEQFILQAEKAAPSFIHALFSGTEALKFLEGYSRSALKNKIPLLATAHMATEEMLQQASALGLKMYAASMYNYNAGTEDNKKFTNAYTRHTGQKANFMALLGYEAGLAFNSLYPSIAEKKWNEVSSVLKNQMMQSPRGVRSFYHGSENSLPVIDIEKIEFSSMHTADKIIVEQGRALQYNDRVFDEIHRENVTGWFNPYLCV